MAILAALDLVVTVDTSLGHLAGEMGKPAWIMLPFAPDWRWLLDRADILGTRPPASSASRRPGGWAPVVATIAAELAECTGTTGLSSAPVACRPEEDLRM